MAQIQPGWIRTFCLLVGAGALLYLGLIAASGVAESLAGIRRIGLPLIGLGALGATLGYLIRFARWEAILRALGHRLPLTFNLRVYLAGLAVTTSPGKLGETIRSVLLLPRNVSVPASLGAFFADRLSDLVGVAALAIAGALAMGSWPTLFGAIGAALLIGPNVLAFMIRKGHAAAWRNRKMHARRPAWLLRLLAPAQNWAEVWTFPRSLAFGVAAMLAYGIQALLLAMYVRASGTTLDVSQGLYVFASSTLIGAASMIPAGLGAMEAAVVYQLVEAGVPFPDAVAAAIAHRLSTLWVGVAIGVGALLSLGSIEDGDRATANADE